MPLKPGDPAPDFTLDSHTGASIHLADFRGKKNVVLYFYPKDNTPGCTKESCTFRDQYAIFQEVGAEVFGVSSDSITSHQSFAEKYQLPFQLLSDPNQKLRKLYGVTKTLGLFPGRVTFIIDKTGIIRHLFDSQLQATRHVEEAVQILRNL